MAKSKKNWVSLTQEKLQKESSKTSCKYVGDKVVHCAEPIPDNDWVGETWGLYFSDYEEELLRLIEHDPDKYIKKHPEDKITPIAFEAKILKCEQKEKTPEVVKADSPPPKVKEKSPEIVKVKQPLPRVKIEPQIIPPIEPETASGLIVGSLGVVPKFEYKTEEGQKYLNKHKEGSNKGLQAVMTRVTCQKCPEESPKIATPPPPTPPPEIPAKKLVDNAQHPSLPLATKCEVQTKQEENDKWSWMKEDRETSKKTKYRLSMYW